MCKGRTNKFVPETKCFVNICHFVCVLRKTDFNEILQAIFF